jgi:dsDNA-specific endonuclease/ATPase MutS2
MTAGTEPGPDEENAEPVARLEVTDELDLHGFQPRDVLDVVESYLEAAQEAGFAEVRLVHGRGTGFQRARVQAFLASSPRVRAHADAPATRGGWGATIAWLEKA